MKVELTEEQQAQLREAAETIAKYINSASYMGDAMMSFGTLCIQIGYEHAMQHRHERDGDVGANSVRYTAQAERSDDE